MHPPKGLSATIVPRRPAAARQRRVEANARGIAPSRRLRSRLDAVPRPSHRAWRHRRRSLKRSNVFPIASQPVSPGSTRRIGNRHDPELLVDELHRSFRDSWRRIGREVHGYLSADTIDTGQRVGARAS